MSYEEGVHKPENQYEREGLSINVDKIKIMSEKIYPTKAKLDYKGTGNVVRCFRRSVRSGGNDDLW